MKVHYDILCPFFDICPTCRQFSFLVLIDVCVYSGCCVI